jgi:hypothetical protein
LTSYSLLPFCSKAAPFGPSLRAANNQQIRCWGTCTIAVAVNGTSYTWTFIRVDVRFPILVINFLHNFQLSVDVAAEQLRPSTVAVASGTQQACAAVAVEADSSSWQAVLSEFPGVIKPLGSSSQPSHSVQHQIITVGPPTAAKFRCLDSGRQGRIQQDAQSWHHL